MDTEKTFSTLDIYLASFVSFHGLSPTIEVRNNKVVFSFEASDRLYHLMNLFNSNQDIPVADYVTTIKTLRGKMLSAKETITGNGKDRRNGADAERK